MLSSPLLPGSPTLPQLATALLGALYLALALIVWLLLIGRARRLAVTAWGLGSVAAPLAVVLVALRAWVPTWAGFTLAIGALFVAPVLRVMALRLHLGEPTRWRPHLLLAALSLGGFQLLWALGAERWRGQFTLTVWTLGTLYLAAWALRCARQTPSRNSRVLAGVELLAAAVLFGYTVSVWAQLLPVQPFRSVWFWPLFVTQALTGLYSQVGFLGMVVDHLHAGRRSARESALRAEDRHLAAQAQAQQLAALLEQRDRLAEQQAELLGLLSHAVQGPLRQAAQALRLDEGDDPQPLPRPRAESAQRHVLNAHEVLDNALQAAALLGNDQALPTRATPLQDWLTEVLQRLHKAEQAQVQLVLRSSRSTVPMEPQLLQLALRNLLRQALRSAGDQGQVLLQVDDADHPPRLQLRVLAPAGVGGAWADSEPGQGGARRSVDKRRGATADLRLALQVAGQIAERHGGQLRLLQLSPNALSAVLELPTAAARPGDGPRD